MISLACIGRATGLGREARIGKAGMEEEGWGVVHDCILNSYGHSV